MGSNRPFNLSKQARRDPPQAFTPYDPLRLDPYRRSKGKPSSGAGDDLLRPGDQGFSNTTPSGGAAFSDNKEWPSDKPFITDENNHPKRDNGTGIVTDHGLKLHDDADIGEGTSGGDSILGENATVTRQIDDNHRDRAAFNPSTDGGVLRGLRKRLRSI